MNAHEYIETGALEAYVLGLASAEEAALAERMRAEHPEVEQEYQAIAASVDTWVQGYAKPAPEGAWDVISARINPAGTSVSDSEKTIERTLSADTYTGPVAGTDGPAPTVGGSGRVIDINGGDSGDGSRTGSDPGRYRFWQAIAAGLALLAAASLGANYWQYGRQNSLKQELAEAQQQSAVLATTASQNSDRASQTQQTLDAVLAQASDPDVQKVVMMGLKDAPQAKVMVMWKKKGHSVTMAMQGMPSMPEGKDLQLWAIVAGKPVDLGVIPMKQGELMEHEIPEVPNATAFAITLEDKGGHPQPQGVMLTMGEVKS